MELVGGLYLLFAVNLGAAAYIAMSINKLSDKIDELSKVIVSQNNEIETLRKKILEDSYSDSSYSD